MSEKLYERMKELSTEMNLRTPQDWIDALKVQPRTFYQLKHNLKKGGGIRYSTLEVIANRLDRFPLILKDSETNWIIRSGKKHLLYNDHLPENYIQDAFEIQREKKDLNKSQVARKSDVSNLTYLNLINKGIISKTSVLEKICGALDIEVLYLHEKKERKKKEIEENPYEEVYQELLKIGRDAMKTPLDYDIKKVKEAIEFIDKIDTEAKKYLHVGLNKIRKAKRKKLEEYKELLKQKELQVRV